MAVHLTGLAGVVLAVPFLIDLATSTGITGRDTAAIVYGLCLTAMIVCSALYNMFPHPNWTWLFRRLDHSAIYLKIVGTYTAFALIAGQGFVLAAVLWAVAVFGIILKLISPARWKILSILLYLGMGWGGVTFGADVFKGLPQTVFQMIAVGGILYSIGVVFHLWTRLPYHNTIWHVFVLAASAAIYTGVATAMSA